MHDEGALDSFKFWWEPLPTEPPAPAKPVRLPDFIFLVLLGYLRRGNNRLRAVSGRKVSSVVRGKS